MLQRSIFKSSALFVVSALCGLALQAQTPMVQVPFVTSVLGIPTSTYNGTTAGTPCTTGLSTTGDGCPGTQSPLWYPYSLAVDSSGDLVTASAAGTQGITVLYEGGSAMAALLVGAKPNYSFTPTVGTAYFVNNGTANLVAVGGVLYCNGVSGTVALDKYANGCPATYAYSQTRSVTMDPDGNIFYGEYEPYQAVRVIYAGGVRAANLIKAYNPTVTTPQVGYIYALSTPVGATNTTAIDFISLRGIAVQPVSATQENVFVADNGGSTAETGADASTAGNQVKEFVCPTGTTGCNTTFAAINGNKNTAAGWVTYIPGTTTASNVLPYGDGGIPSLALVDDPTCLQVDKFGNLFIGDVNDARIRVVFVGGTTPPLFIEAGATNVAVTPLAGNIYTVMGGSSAAPSSPSTYAVTPTAATNFGLDAAGNLYFTKAPSGASIGLWVENAMTGVTVESMWVGATASTFTANGSPGPGAGCNGTAVGAVTGPAMTDAYGDGCPATEIQEELPDFTPFVFDTAGNFYMVDARQPAAATAVVRKYTYGNQLGSVAVGSSVTKSFAFTPSIQNRSATVTGATTYTPVLSFSSPEYSDAGGDNCTTEVGIYATQTCVYNVTFKPTRAGSRPGNITLTQGTTLLDSIVLSGTGTGAEISLDPSTNTTLGTGLTPAGVAVDTSGNAYLADTTTGNMYKSTGGGAPVSFATGLKTPAQVAISGAGTVYVADKGNNRIASVSSAGGAVAAYFPTTATFTLTTLGSPSTTTALATLNAPQGVAVDLSGNVYLSDTGNNRVIEVVTPPGGSGSVYVLLGFSGLSSPQGLAVDASGNVFVADTGNARVVELTPAGVQSVVSLSPSLTTPVGVSLDAAGDLYIADSGSQSIILLPFGSSTPSTLMGSASGLTGLATDNTGDVFVAQSSAGGLVELNRTSVAVTYPLTNVGSTSVQTLTVSDTGNSSLTTGSTLAANTDAVDFSITPATTNGCTTNQTVVSGANCNLAATFQPQAVGKFTDTVTFPSSNAVNPATALLTGTGAKETPTTMALTYATTGLTPTGGLPLAGVAFSVTATITLSANVGTPTGTVTFTVDGTARAPVAITVVNATTISASIPSLVLNAGPHTITAVYSGDGNYAGSGSSLAVTVVTPQTTKLTPGYSLSAPVGNTINTVLTATLSAPSTIAPFSGNVTFVVDNVTQTPAATVSSTGVATITVPLTSGSHTVCATYAGTSYYSTSNGCETFTVVTGTSSITVAANPTGTITFGSSVVVTAVTVTGNSTTTPTGSIIFTINGVSQPAIPYAPSVSLTLALLVPGKYTVCASYTGDGNYAPAQSQTCAVTTVVQSPSTTALQVIPTVTVTTVNGITTVTDSITLTATVGPPYLPVYPTGTVSFTSGVTSLGGAVKLSATGTASYTIPAATLSSLASLVFTASYSGDTNYLSSKVTSPSSFTVSLQNASITMPQNAEATDELGIIGLGGYTGSIKFSCTGLPVNTTCAFSPVPAVFTTANTATAQAVQLQINTNTSPLATATGGFTPSKGGGPWMLCVYLGLSLSLGLFWSRRRRLSQVVLSLVFLATVLGLTACGTNTTDHAVYQTPIGTYAIGVVATDGTNTSTSTLSLTVIAGSSTARGN